jgi:hypothetical protein
MTGETNAGTIGAPTIATIEVMTIATTDATTVDMTEPTTAEMIVETSLGTSAIKTNGIRLRIRMGPQCKQPPLRWSTRWPLMLDFSPPLACPMKATPKRVSLKTAPLPSNPPNKIFAGNY